MELQQRTALQVALLTDSRDRLGLQQLSEFVFDFNLLYELYVLDAIEPGFLERRHSGWILSRTGRRVAPELKLTTSRVRLESPLELVALAPLVPIAILAIERLALAVERIYNIPARRRDLLAGTRLKDAQAAALDAEARLNSLRADRLEVEAFQLEPGLQRYPGYGGNVDAQRSAERRLRRSLRIVDFRIEEVPAPEGHNEGPWSDPDA